MIQHDPTVDEMDGAKERVRAQYGSVGDTYVKSIGHATGSDLARMVELAQPQPTDVLLDVATGGGHVVRVFVPHVARAIASDLTPEILHHAETYLIGLGVTNITYQVIDAEDILLESASIDVVTCRIAPHHFPHPERFVREIARVLRPGGQFVLVDSTVLDGEAGEFFNRFEKLRDPSHVRSLTVDEWLELMHHAGLTAHVVETFTKRHDFADWTARSRASAETRFQLERMMIEAPDGLRRMFSVESDPANPDDLIAFTDTKTLFVAQSRA